MNGEHSPETRERASRMLAEAQPSDPDEAHMEGDPAGWTFGVWRRAIRCRCSYGLLH